MKGRPFLMVILLLLASFNLIFLSMEVKGIQVTKVTIQLDRTDFYINTSIARADAFVEYKAGPPSNLGDLRFTWYRPNGSIAKIEVKTTKNTATANSTVPIDAVGSWAVNGTYVNDTTKFDNRTFEVRSENDAVIVSALIVTTDSPIYENATYARATATLTYIGNESLFSQVNFSWHSATSSLIYWALSTPDSAGIATSSWKADNVGSNFSVNATYLGIDKVSDTTTFDVVPLRVKTWKNESIGGSQIWTKAESPFGVCGNLTISFGSKLTIEAGTIVKFCPSKRLIVEGTLAAEGTSLERIIFTSYEFFPAKGDWDGILFKDTSNDSNSIIMFSKVEYVKNGIVLSQASPTIMNNEIEKATGKGIELFESEASIPGNTINNTYIGIYQNHSNGIIDGNTITNNFIGISNFESRGRISNCLIANNTDSGIFVLKSSLLITNNKIFYNRNRSVWLDQSSNVTIRDSILYGGNYSLKVLSSTNITVSSSILSSNVFRALDFTSSSRVEVINSTISNSTIDVQLIGSTITLINCTFNGSRLTITAGSKLIVKNFLHVLVQQISGSPVPDANIEIKVNEVTYPPLKTDSQGWARWILLTDRTYEGPSIINKNIIVVRVFRSGFNITTNNRTLDMSFSRVETFIAIYVGVPPTGNGRLDTMLLLLLGIVLLALLVALPIMRRRKEKRFAEQRKAEIPVPLSAKLEEIELELGGSYLIAEEKPDSSFKLFSQELEKGAKGLCLSRIYPEEARKKYNIGDVPIRWLSRGFAKESINPTNLGAILQEIDRFTTGKENSIVLLDGLEYLIVQNDFAKVVKFVQTLKDIISLHQSKLLLPFNPKTLEETNRAILARDLKTL